MTIKEIVDHYLATKRLHRVSGGDDDASVLLPHIMMDMARTLFNDYVDKVDCKFTLKKLKNEWKKSYHQFNRDLFSVMDEEQTDFIVDMMDDFEKFIKKDLTIAFYQVTNVCKEETFEKQKVLAACVMISIFCQSANIVWQKVFTPTSKADKPQSNINLLNCNKYIREWQILYRGKHKPTVDCNKDETIALAIDILCRQQVKFLKIYHTNK